MGNGTAIFNAGYFTAAVPERKGLSIFTSGWFGKKSFVNRDTVAETFNIAQAINDIFAIAQSLPESLVIFQNLDQTLIISKEFPGQFNISQVVSTATDISGSKSQEFER